MNYSFTFPGNIKTRQKMFSADRSSSMAMRHVQSYVLRELALCEASKIRFSHALEELRANLFMHDQVDVHGADRNEIKDVNLWRTVEKRAYFQSKLCAAQGRTNKVTVVTLNTTEILIRITLSQPFEAFTENWRYQGEILSGTRTPTEEELALERGRGLLLIQNFFQGPTTIDENCRIITLSRKLVETDFENSE